MEEKTHNLGGRNIDPKKANPRKKEEVIKKIFVGKVDPSLTEAEIKEYFETFGEVCKFVLFFFFKNMFPKNLLKEHRSRQVHPNVKQHCEIMIPEEHQS